MAKSRESQQSLFARLARLFRSGPVVKRKVRAINTSAAAPDKQSSGMLLFQKGHGSAYANITSQAYNMSERLMRYQDFQEMEYTPELACVTKNALISTPEGDFTIAELIKLQEQAQQQGSDDALFRNSNGVMKFPVYCYDQAKKRIEIGWGHDIRKTKTAPVVKVTFDSGRSITCTPDHLFLTRSGAWVQAGSLTQGTAMMPFKVRELQGGYKYVYTMDRQATKSGWQAQHIFNVERLVRPLASNEVVHHRNFDRRDNRLTNLEIMDDFEHSSFHARLNNVHKLGVARPDHSRWMMDNNPAARCEPTLDELKALTGSTLQSVIEKFDVSITTINAWLRKHGHTSWRCFQRGETAGDGSARIAVSELSLDAVKTAYTSGMTKSELTMRLGCTVNVFDKFCGRRLKKTWTQLVIEFGGTPVNAGAGRPAGTLERPDVTYQRICDVVVPGTYMTAQEIADALGASVSTVMSRIRDQGFSTFTAWVESYHNCKVVSVEPAGVEDVYDLTVDEHHNFACEGTIVHNSALDIYADETCSQDEKGRVLHIHSDNPRIKGILEDLFYDTLNVDFNLRPWVRNTCKYGDMTLYTDVSAEHGVVNVFPIAINEVEREEGFDRKDPFAVRYRWVSAANRVLENWEVAHFRLLGNDMFLPYGTSVLEAARRIWRQLILIEDAMLVYRITRAPERRVFYFDVGNMPPEAIPAAAEELKMHIRANQVVDNRTGRVDLRYNPMSIDEDYYIPVRGNESGTKIDTLAGGQNTAAVEDVEYIQKKMFAALKIPRAYLGYDEALCLTGDTMVPLLDGKPIMISELARRFAAQTGHEEWTYSCDPASGRVVPGRIINAWKTKDVTELLEVELDDGGRIRCTENHPFLCRDGEYRRADELIAGQSLMPLYRRLSHGKKHGGSDLIDGYEMVLDNSNNEYVYTHKLVSDAMNGSDPARIGKQRVVHHVDFNKRNNVPSNLREMTWHDHRRLHANHLETTLLRPDVIAAREPKRIAALKSPVHRQKRSVQMIQQHADASSKLSVWVHGDQISSVMSDIMRKNWQDSTYRDTKTRQNAEIWQRDDVRSKLSGDNHWCRRKNAQYDIPWLRKFCVDNQVTSVNQWRSDYARSVAHMSPVSIRWIKTILKEAGFPSWRDFKKTIPYNHKVVAVRRIFFDAPVPVYDLTVENTHSFAVCWPMQGSDDSTKDARSLEPAVFVHNSSKATLAQEDIRFSRTIAIIQKTIVAELNKIAIIHLFANGFETEDLLNFTLKLSNPSTVAQQQKLELLRARFEIAGSVPEGLLDKKYLRREVLDLSEERIREIDENRFLEKQIDAAIDEGEGGGAGGGGGGGGGGSLFGGGGGAAPPAGGDDDLGGDLGDLGGGDDAGAGADAAPADDDEPDEDLNAGNEPEEDEDPELELLTAADDPDDPGPRRLPSTGARQLPIKPGGQLARAMNNRARQRTHGASKTHMPDFGSMVSATNRSVSDPTDARWFKALVSDPFGEAVIAARPAALPADTRSMLERMATKLGMQASVAAHNHDGVLTEEQGRDVQRMIDLGAPLDDDVPDDSDELSIDAEVR